MKNVNHRESKRRAAPAGALVDMMSCPSANRILDGYVRL
jgi:hypothetical protein